MESNRVAELEKRVQELEAKLVSAQNLSDNKLTTSSTSEILPPQSKDLPGFAQALRKSPSHRQVKLREWEDTAWRAAQGWKGRDLCHNPDGKGVRLLEYFWEESSQTLTGVVWFGPEAESHRGLCHGGAMCALLDDVCGYYAFMGKGGQPWGGCTVQVNSALRKPVQVGSVLRVVATGEFGETKRGMQKVKIRAVLDEPPLDTTSTLNPFSAEFGKKEGDASCAEAADNKANGSAQPVVYANLEGLSISGIRITAEEEHLADSVGTRTWVDTTDAEGKAIRVDSSYDV